MSENNPTYDEFRATLPESVTSDTERLLNVCKAAKVDVPLAEQFYVKNHTPKKGRNHPNPEPIDYVVIPHTKGGRPFWVECSDWPALLKAANAFGETL